MNSTAQDTPDATPSHERTESAPSMLAGRYRVESVLGVGGMGVVYLAHDTTLGRPVALKLLHPSSTGSRRGLQERLVRESRAMAKLAHGNVLTVFDVGTCDGSVFIAMEYVNGTTLRQWVRDVRPGWKEILARFRRAGEGLAAAHAAGVVHRDFKPDNVLVDGAGRVLVTDFGLAQFVDTAPSTSESGVEEDVATDSFGEDATRTGAVLGTPAYMAPEQFEGGSADARTDVFSFCASLWEALYGTRPFPGGTATEIHAAIRRAPPLRPAYVRYVPRGIEHALRRGLQADPGNRFPTVEALLRALHPPRVAVWQIAGVALTVVAVGAATLISHERTDPCPGVPADLMGVWDPVTQAALAKHVHDGAASGAEETWRRITDIFDRGGTAWLRAREHLCGNARAAGGTAPQAQLECLNDRRGELRAFKEFVHRTSPAELASKLSGLRFVPPDGCAQRDERAVRQPLPTDPTLAATVSSLREQIQNARATVKSGRPVEGAAQLKPVIERALSLGYPPIVAEALFASGMAQSAMREPALAAKTLLEAGHLAESSHHDVTAAWCWLMLAPIAASDLENVRAAEEYAARTRAAIARLGGDAELEVRVAYQHGLVEVVAGRYDAAEQAFAESIARAEYVLPDEVPLLFEGLGHLYEARGEYARAADAHRTVLEAQLRVNGPNDPDLAITHTNLGSAEQQLGNVEAAMHHVQESARIVEQTFGKEHSDYVIELHNVGEMMRDVGRYDDALRTLDEARALMIARGGKNAPRYAGLLNSRGGALLGLRRYQEAVRALEEALIIQIQVFGEEHPVTTQVQVNLAEALSRTGRHRDALRLQRRSLTAFRQALGARHPFVCYTQAEIGKTLLVLGPKGEARQILEAAVACYEQSEGAPDFVAEALFHLAVAVDAPGAPRQRALALARDAIAGWERNPTSARDRLNEVREWIAERTGARAGTSATRPGSAH